MNCFCGERFSDFSSGFCRRCHCSRILACILASFFVDFTRGGKSSVILSSNDFLGGLSTTSCLIVLGFTNFFLIIGLFDATVAYASVEDVVHACDNIDDVVTTVLRVNTYLNMFVIKL